MNSLMIKNIKTIGLLIYLVNDFKRINITLIKFICFDNIDRLKYEIVFMQAK